MSSFIAIINGTDELIKKAERITGLRNVLTASSDITILADPLSDRLFYELDSDQKSGWVISGIGIQSYPNLSLMSTIDWARFLASRNPEIHKLNGHFAGACFGQNQIDFFTDSVGMRSLFITKVGDSILISTRFDWLIPFSAKSIDWNKFGAHWLSVNPFSGESFVEGIIRLRGSASYDVQTKRFEIKQKPWLPSEQKIDVEGFLKELIRSIYSEKQHLGLGLSGGLDSRVLFALLADTKLSVSTYTFGGIDHPDEKIVQQLIRLSKSDHQPISYESASFSLDKLKELSARTMLNSSVSDVLTNALYQQLGQQALASIDGGIGEIGRRRYLKNVELRAGNAVTKQDAETLLPFFLAPKADFFTEEINKKMNAGYKQDLTFEMTKMPDVNTIGLPNWLDLFSIRTRLSNIAGLSQEVVDDTHFHIMPFVQTDFLSGILTLPVDERNNARLFRRLIKKHKAELTKIPLVKGDEQYPFWMKDLTATIWNKLQAKFKTRYTNTLVPNILLKNEAEIRDLFAAKTVKESGVYNPKKVEHILSSFYELNDYTFASPLNWMLTFELFRKSLSDEN